MIFDSLASANSVLLINDGFTNYLPIIKQFFLRFLPNVEIVLLCFQRRIEEYEQAFKGLNIKYIDASKKPPDINLFNANSVIVIDSINHVSLLQSWEEVVKLLYHLIFEIRPRKFISTLNTDFLINGEQMTVHCKHLFQLHINMNRVNNKSLISMYYKKSGKVVKATEEVICDNKTGAISTAQLIKEDKKEESQSVLPHSVASFRIGLKDDEVEARDKVQLPYMTRGAGQIVYTPEAVDDWDDEDPDEDLEI